MSTVLPTPSPVLDARTPAPTGRAKARALAVVGGVASLAMVAGVGAAMSAHAADLTTIRMSTAATPVVDASGATWAARYGFADGRLITPPAAGTVIRGTSDQALYLTAMFTMSAWSAPVVNGSYDVTLRMVDTWYGQANQRQFTVNAEGKAALSNVDIAGSVGQFAAYDRTFTVTVTDGTLNLGFVALRSAATVSAIAVVPSQTPTTPPSTPPSTPPTTPTPQPTGAIGNPSPALPPSTPPSTPPKTPPPSTPPSTPPTTTPPSTGERPGPTNTGVPAGTILTRWDSTTGPIRLTTPGATYQNLDIHARIRILAPNITIKNSIIRGDASYQLGSIIDVNYPGYDHSNFTLLNSEVVPEFPQWQQDGILGNNYNVIGSNIHGTTDAVKIVGDNIVVRDSWLHDTTYFVVPGVGYGDTHNDGIQAVKGSHVRVINNTITGNKNAAIMLGQDAGMITDWTIEGNYLDNGGCSINTAAKSFPTMGPLAFTNNVFGSGQTNNLCAIVANPTKTVMTAVGNTWAVNGTAVAVTRGL